MIERTQTLRWCAQGQIQVGIDGPIYVNFRFVTIQEHIYILYGVSEPLFGANVLTKSQYPHASMMGIKATAILLLYCLNRGT